MRIWFGLMLLLIMFLSYEIVSSWAVVVEFDGNIENDAYVVIKREIIEKDANIMSVKDMNVVYKGFSSLGERLSFSSFCFECLISKKHMRFNVLVIHPQLPLFSKIYDGSVVGSHEFIVTADRWDKLILENKVSYGLTDMGIYLYLLEKYYRLENIDTAHIDLWQKTMSNVFSMMREKGGEVDYPVNKKKEQRAKLLNNYEQLVNMWKKSIH